MEETIIITDVATEVVSDIVKGKYIVGYGVECDIATPYIVEDFADVDIQYYKQMYARFANEPLVIAKTPNLLIREISLDDLDALYELYETLSDCRFVEKLYERKQEEEFTKKYIENMYAFYNYGLWLVFEKHSGKLVGRIGIENREIDGVTSQELGYLVGKPYQNKGYAYEACCEVLKYAKDYLCLEKMYICMEADNEPSKKLAEKLDFKPYAESDNGYIIWMREM